MYDDSEEDEWSRHSSSDEDEEAGNGRGVLPAMQPGPQAQHAHAAVEEDGDSSSSDDDEDDSSDDGGAAGVLAAEYEAEEMRVLKLLGQVVRKRLGEGHPETVYAHVSCS